MSGLVYPIMSLDIISANILFPLGTMIRMVQLQTSFILTSWSWEIDDCLSGNAGRIKLSYVIPAMVNTFDPFIYLDVRSSISV